MIQSPCKNCPKCGCGAYHSQCDKYLKFKEQLELEKHLKIVGECNAYAPMVIRKKRKHKNRR